VSEIGGTKLQWEFIGAHLFKAVLDGANIARLFWMKLIA